MDFIDHSMKQNDELTSSALQRLFQQQFQVDFSETKIKRLSQSLGWLSSGT